MRVAVRMRVPGMTRVVSVGMRAIRRADVIMVMGLVRLTSLSVGMAMLMVMGTVMGMVMLMAAVTD